MRWQAHSLGLSGALGAFLICSHGVSQIRQPPENPSGTIIPVIVTGGGCKKDGVGVAGEWGDVQLCLDEHEATLGGSAGGIDALNDASIDQETFDPQCQLTFSVVQRGAGYKSVFGWYPATGGTTRPALSDMHVLLGCDDAPGAEKVLTVPPEVDEVGFFMANKGFSCVGTVAGPYGNGDQVLNEEPTNLFFSERRFNGRDANGNPLGGVDANLVKVLVWQSAAVPESFYFGWEDELYTSDNDFEDLLTYVSGIECSQGGGACDTGLIGQCGEGTMQCRGGGLECVPTQEPVAETCNAIDDDCNGQVDDGDALCDPGMFCFRGNCVGNCGGGEFKCPAGFKCDSEANVCVEADCEGITCEDGQVCRGGKCVGECVGVRCPYGQACRRGGCVDVCAGLVCDEGFVCAIDYRDGPEQNPVGYCSSCSCKGCSAGFSCVDDVCVPDACATVSCGEFQHCEAGQCVDDCQGAVCPSGEKCEAGRCVLDPNASTGGTTGEEPDGGIVISIGGTGGGLPGIGGSNGLGGSGQGPGSKLSRGSSEPRACGCRVPGGGQQNEPGWGAVLLGLALGLRRRSARLRR